MNRKQTRNSLLVIFLLTLGVSVLTVSVEAEPTAAIYPSKGIADTEIFLQVRGFGIGEGWDVHYKLYLFWDSKPIMTGVDDGGGHFYDIYFEPPNEHPYLDLGNHTVFVELYRSHYGWTFIANFTLIFEIVEWAPCPQYLALNATYNALLVNYSDLLGDYNLLLADYYLIVAEHDDLQDEFNSLSADYNALLDNYDNLVTHFEFLNSTYYGLESVYESLNSSYYDLLDIYTELQSDYDDLQEDYDSLSASYDSLQALYESLLEDYADLLKDYNSLDSDYDTMEEEHISLESDHNNLETSYNTLNSTYNDLKSEHETLTANLGATRISSYAFIIIAILFIGTTSYLAIRSRKLKR